MWTKRGAGVLGLLFIVTAALYWILGNHIDAAGATLLLLAGVAMAFGFATLIAGSRNL
jgi:hypothetical protein